MGLRFRKSVTLCKGVKLNMGKTGMSVSIGGKGFHKTINTKGQVTTSIGIPGTGIYYTDTKNIRDNRNSITNRRIENNDYEQDSFIEPEESYSINSTVEQYLNSENPAEQTYAKQSELSYAYEDTGQCAEKVSEPISYEDIKAIYVKCDETIDWTELLVSSSSEDVFMDQETWSFLKGISRRVLSGDIDAYLETIETMRPVDDLLDYGSDFEFGTDNPNFMEVEFHINERGIFPDVNEIGLNQYEKIFNEYVCACSIRVARDLFALLPVKYVIVYAKRGEVLALQAKFERNEILKINFREESCTEIIGRFVIKM